MSLKIRLSRGGAKKRPFYRIVVADARMPRDGRFVEKIGTFDPVKPKDDANRLVLDAEKAKAWIAKGAQPTDRVARFLAKEGLTKWEHGNNPNKAKPGKKAEERAAERAQREEDAKAAAAEAAANPPPPPEPEPEVVAEEPAAAEAAPEAAAEEAAPEAAAEAPAAEEPAAEAAAEPAAAEAAPAEEPAAE